MPLPSTRKSTSRSSVRVTPLASDLPGRGRPSGLRGRITAADVPIVGRVYLQTPVRTACALWAAALVWLGPDAARADDLYRYVDKRGVIHFTNVSYDRRYTLVRPPSG